MSHTAAVHRNGAMPEGCPLAHKLATEELPRLHKSSTRGAFLGALVGGVLHFVVIQFTGCTPAERATVAQDAYNVEPYLFQGCGMAADVPAVAPYVDIICAGAEALDKALAGLPSDAKVVSTSVVVKPTEAGVPTAVTYYRIRCSKVIPPLAEPALDAGAAAAASASALTQAAQNVAASVTSDGKDGSP